MSSFRGIDLFGSGPHRFSLGPQGLQILPNGVIFGSDLLPGFQAIGPTETQVLVTGRPRCADGRSALGPSRCDRG